MLFLALWAYYTTAKTSMAFTPFQLVYGLEVVFSIKCEILDLKLSIELLPTTSVEEECFFHLAHLDETCHEDTLASEAHKKWVKAQFDQSMNPRSYVESDLVLVSGQAHDKLGARKFKPMWHGPYIVKHFLSKGPYELVDYDGVSLGKSRNGLYL